MHLFGEMLARARGSESEPRHVKIKNMSDFDESELIRLLKEAERIAKLLSGFMVV
jgi:hypothetical protein